MCSANRHPITVDRAVPVPMRDGVTLYADIYRPANQVAPLPVLLMRLPYGRDIASTVTYAHPSWYAAQGFVVVIQEVRGCGKSEGTFYPFQPVEMTDGVDTLRWCQELPETTGNIGMYGFSYQGVTQFQAIAAGGADAGLVTVCPAMATIDFYRGWMYWGGALALDFVVPWAIQLAQDQAQFARMEPQATELGRARTQLQQWLNATPLDTLPLLTHQPVGNFYADWIREAIADSDYYDRLNPASHLDRVDLPALHIAGWADPFLEATLDAFHRCHQKSSRPQHLIIGPWQHIPWSQHIGDLDFGPEARSPIDKLQVQWFNRWLKSETPVDDDSSEVRIFEMGRNRWRTYSQWPPETSSCILWLHSNGLAQGPDGDGILSQSPPQPTECTFDTYVYDPRIATPSTPYGPYDQRAVQHRPDLLLYTSKPWTEVQTIIGSPVIEFYASTTAVDTDWVVKLVKVLASGAAILMTAGVLRARFRYSLTQPTPLVPNEIERYRISLRPTCWSLEPGDRLQVAIASGAFPWIDRNPNTGQWPASARYSEFEIATQTMFHSPDLQSRIEIQICPSI